VHRAHVLRHSPNYVYWKRRKDVTADLRSIYTAATTEEAELCLGEFKARWDTEYLLIGQSWRRKWSRLAVLRLPSGNPQGHLHNQRH
jgi:putative transposase